MKRLWGYTVSATMLALILLPLAASAQADRTAKKEFAYRGSWEVGGSLGFLASTPVVDGSTGDTRYTFMATPYVGYFLIHGLEIGANPLAVTWSKQSGSTTTDLRLLGSVAYNFFAAPGIHPYVEGLAGYTRRESGSSTASGFTWGGRGGVKLAVLEQAVLVVGGEYLRVTLDPAGADARNGSNEISAFAGWSVWF